VPTSPSWKIFSFARACFLGGDVGHLVQVVGRQVREQGNLLELGGSKLSLVVGHI